MIKWQAELVKVFCLSHFYFPQLTKLNATLTFLKNPFLNVLMEIIFFIIISKNFTVNFSIFLHSLIFLMSFSPCRWCHSCGSRLSKRSQSLCTHFSSFPLWSRRSGCIGPHLSQGSLPFFHPGVPTTQRTETPTNQAPRTTYQKAWSKCISILFWSKFLFHLKMIHLFLYLKENPFYWVTHVYRNIVKKFCYTLFICYCHAFYFM